MLEFVFLIMGVYCGSIAGKIVFYLLFYMRDSSRYYTDDTDESRRRFERICNTALFELSVKQKHWNLES